MNDELNNNNAEPEENSAAEQRNTISADLIRGHINTIILRTLYERDKYGYEIIDEIENKSHGQYSMKQPTLYSALKRLENQGYITAYWKTDEVSLGGRRKYFTLTDSGREMAEKNQAEWEYSRTVIDSLISERNFDFSQPAPTAVDFKILKNSTSRVPLVKHSDENEIDEEADSEQNPKPDLQTEAQAEAQADSETQLNAIPSYNTAQPPIASEPVPEINSQPPQYETMPEPIPDPIIESISKTVSTPAIEQVPDQISEPAPEPVVSEPIYEPPQPMSDEQRRRVHENYLKLISEPIRKDNEESETPYADEIDTNKLIYNNRPEPERDYKNLVNSLFVKTIRSSPEEPDFTQQIYSVPDDTANTPVQQDTANVHVQPTPPIAPIAYDYASAKASDDGLTVNTSEFTVSNAQKKYFHLSKTLLKCSLIVFAVLMVEFVISLICKDNLGVTIAYPLIILAIACVQVVVFGVMRYTDFGKATRKPTSLTYITVCSVIAILAILIIIVVSLLLNIDFSSVGDIMAKIVLPCIIALNIPLFATLFYLFSKS